MSKKTDLYWMEALDAAEEYYHKALWENYTQREALELSVRGVGKVYALIMGYENPPYGLYLFYGPNAYDRLRRHVCCLHPEMALRREERLLSLDCMGLAFSTAKFASCFEEQNQLLQGLGVEERFPEEKPVFILYRPYRILLPMKTEEAEICTKCIAAVLEAADAVDSCGLLQEEKEEENLILYHYEGAGKRPWREMVNCRPENIPLREEGTISTEEAKSLRERPRIQESLEMDHLLRFNTVRIQFPEGMNLEQLTREKPKMEWLCYERYCILSPVGGHAYRWHLVFPDQAMGQVMLDGLKLFIEKVGIPRSVIVRNMEAKAWLDPLAIELGLDVFIGNLDGDEHGGYAFMMEKNEEGVEDDLFEMARSFLVNLKIYTQRELVEFERKTDPMVFGIFLVKEADKALQTPEGQAYFHRYMD